MYKSIHEYLDVHLGDNPTDQDIKQCKTDYWKWYRTHHRKQRTKEAKALHLTISKKVWKHLQIKAKKYGIDVYIYIKRHLRHGIDTTLEVDRKTSANLMQSTQLIQDYLYGDISLEMLQATLEKMILKT